MQLRINPSMFTRPALLLAGLTLLAGCGFHLRGNIDLPPELARVYVSGQDRDLVEQLSEALAQSGAKVMRSAHGAAVIDLSAAEPRRETLTTDSSGRATAYTLHYEVVFRVTDSGGASLQAAQSFSLQRTFDYDPSRQLQAEEEADFLKARMRQEAVLQIVRRLRRI